MLLVIIAVVVAVIINQSSVELGSRAEDILLEQARVAELKAELERAEVEEREELAALRLEMQILEKENAKNVLTLEKELIASGLKGKDAEDALRKELEETRLAEQVKVAAIQIQLDKVKTLEQNKVKAIQSELDKSQARIGLMEANVEKLKNKPIAEIADLKKKLSEAVISTRDAQEKADAQASLIKSQKSEASKELKAIQAELNTLKQAEADKRKTLNTKLGDSADTIEDLEEEIAYLKSQAASVNKKSGNTPQSSSGRVITKGPKSLEMSPAMREKLQAARYKAENNEKNEALVGGDGGLARHTGPIPSIDLEKLGPPSNIMRPAVCRDIPGSAVDSCGRPSKIGSALSLVSASAAAEKAAAEKAAATKKAAAEKAAAEKAAAEKAAAAKKAAAEKAAAEKAAAAQKKADARAKIVAIAAAVKKAMALKEERDRIAAEKAAAAAAAKKVADAAAAAAAQKAWIHSNCEPCHRTVRCEPPTNECYGCFSRNAKRSHPTHGKCPHTWEPCPGAPPGRCPRR